MWCVGLATNNRFYASHNHGAEIYGIHFPRVNFAFHVLSASPRPFSSHTTTHNHPPPSPLHFAFGLAKHASCRAAVRVSGDSSGEMRNMRSLWWVVFFSIKRGCFAGSLGNILILHPYLSFANIHRRRRVSSQPTIYHLVTRPLKNG